MYCEVALEGGEKEGGGGLRGENWGYQGRQTANYICESGSREIMVVQCNYCQEGEMLLLLSRMRGAGPVQAR